MTEGSPCRRPDCNVATLGICALGNDPVESCDEYEAEEAALDHGDDEAEAETTVDEVESKRRLHRSEALNHEELWRMRKAAATTTVCLVGDVKAGKTTLIAALYSSFCKGPFAGFEFRSSRTLTAFARRHHRALERSREPLPVTDRTSRQEGVGFFHLNVVSALTQHHLLIADRSGEDFREASRDTSLIPNLWELEMADRVCFILDSGKLANPETRTGYKRKFKQLIWALLHNRAISENAILEVVSTKLDKLAPKPGSVPVVDELDEFEKEIQHEFVAEGRRITVRRICALPRSNFEVGLIGLEELFKGWLEPRPVKDLRPLPAIDPVRWIDKMRSS